MEELLQLEESTNGQISVDVWACDLQGRVALHLAAENYFEDVCVLLLRAMEKGEGPSTEGREEAEPGQTPQKIGADGCGKFRHTAPEDLTGSTPLGWAKRKANGRPPANIEALLFRHGDNSIIPKSPFVSRTGRTPHRESRSAPHAALRSCVAVSSLEGSVRSSTDSGGCDGLFFASSDAQGWRPTMEDRIIMRCPLTSDEDGGVHWGVFAVLDGHGGDFSSDFVSKTLPEIVSAELRGLDLSCALRSDEGNVPVVDTLHRAVSRCCSRAEEVLSEQDRMMVSAKYAPPFRDAPPKTELLIRDVSGTTLCLCIVGEDHLVVANIGDSRAVLACCDDDKSLVTVPLSEDHKFSIPSERVRAEKAGFM